MRTLWFALIACLVGAVLSASYPFARTTWEGWHAARAQASLAQALPTQVPQAQAPQTRTTTSRTVPVMGAVDPGEPLARMWVPRWGKDWEWIVVEGTDLDALADGPGHYAGTPLPGARGNSALAAHRAGHGNPFIDFDLLRRGDEVRLEQAGTTWVYEIDAAPEIIEADEHEVLDPLPGRRLTLTTCWPKWGSSKRMVVTATLADVRSAGAGLSAAP